MSEQRISVTRRIAAPAQQIWDLVADSAGHVRIDGSGMLEAADPGPLTEVGQTFDIHMDRTPLNDIPGLVKYSVRNTVTALEPGTLVEWTIGPVDGPPFGHVYGWHLAPAGDGVTEVTNYCDWTNVIDALRVRTWPIVPIEMLEATVARLDSIATGG